MSIASLQLGDDGLGIALEEQLAHHRLSLGTITLLLIVSGTLVALYLSHMIVVVSLSPEVAGSIPSAGEPFALFILYKFKLLRFFF